MWFSPLKGAHLTLGQLDKTLPVDTSVEANKTIERGMFVYIKADNSGTAIAPRFALYTQTEAAKPNAVPYIALMSVKDFQAGMAGNVGQAPIAAGTATGTKATGNNLEFLAESGVQAAVNGPRITAISVVQPAEYQTTAFESANNETYYVGCPLTISNNGKLTPFTTGKNIVGYVTAVPKSRWINDLGASVDGARISGGNAKVIEFSTAWIPVASLGQPGTEGAGTTPGALNVGAPKVQPAAAPAAAPAAPKGNEAPKAK